MGYELGMRPFSKYKATKHILIGFNNFVYCKKFVKANLIENDWPFQLNLD